MASEIPTYGLYGERKAEKEDFWVHCETIASRSRNHRWEIGLHRHENFFQILYIRDGAGDALIGSATLPLGPRCAVLMPPKVSHGYRFSQDVEGVVITVVADHLRLSRDARRRAGDRFSKPQLIALQGHGDADYVESTIYRIAGEFNAHRNGRDDLIEGYLAILMMLLGRLAAPESKAVQGVRHGKVEALKEMIAKDFRDQLPVVAYAHRLNLSPTHLNRIVREVMGMTVHDLIMARVIDEARRALVFTPATVQQIAASLGFSDAGYFSRCFRIRTGQTPSTFRRTERNKLNEGQSPNHNGTEVIDIGSGRASDE